MSDTPAQGWFTSADADDPTGPLASAWPGLYNLTGDQLDLYLSAAADQCAEFAPALPPGAPIPDRYRLAQALQARALARAGTTVGGSDALGEDAATVFPMDWTVKNILRPKRGKPGIG